MSTASTSRRGAKEMETFEYDPTASQLVSKVAAYDAGLTSAARAYAAELRPQDEHALVSEPFDPKLAFEHFAGAVFVPSRPCTGSAVASAASASAAAAAAASVQARFARPETPEERLQRFRREVAAFKSELEVLTRRHKAAAAVANAGSTPNNNANAPLAAALLVQTDLDLLAEELGAASLTQDAAAVSKPPGAAAGAAASLAAGLKTIKPSASAPAAAGASASSTVAAAAGTSSATMTVSTGMTVSEAAAAERRLAKLEQVVGMSRASDLASADLCSGLAALGRQVELLDMGRIERIVRRTRSLAAELDLLTAKQQQQATAAAVAATASSSSAPAAVAGTPAAAAAAGGLAAAGAGAASTGGAAGSAANANASGASREQLNAMYTLLQRWDSVAAAVPTVVARLQSLRGVHDEAVAAVARVAAVSQQHDAALKRAHDAKAAATALAGAVEDNARVMAGNVEALQGRMEALTAKVDKLLAQRK